MVNVFSVDNFDEEVKKYNGICLVDFYADWCGPCKMMAPVIEEISNENENIKVGKVNVDENIPLTEEFGIMSIPSIFVFKNGKAVANFVGVTPKEKIVEALK